VYKRQLIKSFIEGLRLLEDEYLGGSGTRGYGHIRFDNLAFYVKNIESYIKDNRKALIETEARDLSGIDITKLSQAVVNNLKVNKK